MKTILVYLFFSLPLTAESAVAAIRNVSATTDGIEVTASAITESDGRTLIRCAIINHSKHLLAGAFARSWSKAFRFTLLDQAENTIPMDKEWALRHAQPDDTNGSIIDRMSLMAAHIHPGKSETFEFHLEDAYAGRAKDGKVLEVKWHNIYPSQGGVVSVDEMTYPDGTVTPAITEKNHFPGLRVFAVTLPLTNDKPNGVIEPADTKPEQGVSASNENPASQTQTENREPIKNPESFDFRWLFLLLIPVFVLLFRFCRSRKAS